MPVAGASAELPHPAGERALRAFPVRSLSIPTSVVLGRQVCYVAEAQGFTHGWSSHPLPTCTQGRVHIPRCWLRTAGTPDGLLCEEAILTVPITLNQISKILPNYTDCRSVPVPQDLQGTLVQTPIWAAKSTRMDGLGA